MLDLITSSSVQPRRHYNAWPKNARKITESDFMAQLCHENFAAKEFKQCIPPKATCYCNTIVFWVDVGQTFGILVTEIDWWKKEYHYYMINRKKFDQLARNRTAAFAGDSS